MLRQFARIALGEFFGFSVHPEEDDSDRVRLTKAFDAALGLSGARTDRVGEVGPILSGEYDVSVLRGVAEALGRGQFSKRLALITDAELLDASVQLATLLARLNSALSIARRFPSSPNFGLARIAKLATDPKLESHILLTLFWIVARRQNGLAAGAAKFLSATAFIDALAAALERNPEVRPSPEVRITKLAAPWPHRHPQPDSTVA